jgi:hypothetical protein
LHPREGIGDRSGRGHCGSVFHGATARCNGFT